MTAAGKSPLAEHGGRDLQESVTSHLDLHPHSYSSVDLKINTDSRVSLLGLIESVQPPRSSYPRLVVGHCSEFSVISDGVLFFKSDFSPPVQLY